MQRGISSIRLWLTDKNQRIFACDLLTYMKLLQTSELNSNRDSDIEVLTCWALLYYFLRNEPILFFCNLLKCMSGS